MNDMSSTIIAKSDQINASDLVGGPVTLTVREVQIKASGADDQPVSIFFEGEKKAFRPCKGVRRLLVNAWGADANKYIGCSLTLFRDPSVTWAGKEEGGIRVSHMSHIDSEFVEWMRTSRAATKPYKIKPLVVEQQAEQISPAQKYARAYISQVGEITDATKLNEFANTKAKKLAELQSANPALHTECITALDRRRAELAGGFSDDEEGPATEQRGEGFVDDAPYAATVAQIKAMIGAIKDADSYQDARDEYGLHMEALPKPVCDEIEGLLAEKRPA